MLIFVSSVLVSGVTSNCEVSYVGLEPELEADVALTAFRFRVIPGIASVTVLVLLTTATPSTVSFAC